MTNPEMSVVPSGGGWRFLQRLPNGAMKTFLETSEAKLFDAVTEFRKNNNLPVGNLDRELKIGMSAPVAHVYSDQRSLRERVTSWLANRQFGTVRYVPQEVAEERARLAASDIHNIVEYADACLECYQSTLRGLFAIRQGKTTSYDDRLGACDIHGWDNRTAVHLDTNCLQGIKASDPCWCASLLDKDAPRGVE